MTTYKNLDASSDTVESRTLLHEAIPLTGTIVSGTYDDANIKDFAHGMFQSVYDYPYLSSSANHIFDISVGVGAQSSLYSSVATQQAKKANVYNQMAQVLMGYDVDGSIQRFDKDGNLADGGDKLDNVFFVNFARLLSKDEIKKGTFQMELGVDPEFSQDGHSVFQKRILITDFSGSNGFLVNSPAGEYGVLYATGSKGANVMNREMAPGDGNREPVGLLYYQAGVAVISGSVFKTGTAAAATATITVADGNVAHGLTAGQKLTLTDHEGTIVDYFVSDTGDGGVAHEGAVTAGATLKSTGAITATLTPGATRGIAVGFNLSGGTQNAFLVLLKEAIEDTLGHNGKITVSAVPGAAPGNQSITITQSANGSSGNTLTSENMANLTVTNFTGGGDGGDGVLAASIGDSSLLSTSTNNDMNAVLTGSHISSSADAIRNRLYNIQFNNTIELNSKIYFCRVPNNQFNYSSNPTYLTGSKIFVKQNGTDMPVSYITTVGLYNDANELLAVAKLSEPLKKTPDTEFTIRVRLDY